MSLLAHIITCQWNTIIKQVIFLNAEYVKYVAGNIRSNTCELKIIRITGHKDTLPSEFFDKMFSQFF